LTWTKVKEEMDKLWNLAIVILKNKSVIVGNEKCFIFCIFFSFNFS
jgi:hypothetical protein